MIHNFFERKSNDLYRYRYLFLQGDSGGAMPSEVTPPPPGVDSALTEQKDLSGYTSTDPFLPSLSFKVPNYYS